jgi:hypothetical protein
MKIDYFYHSFLNGTLRSSSTLALDIPPHSTDFLSYSFSVHAVQSWNFIPDNIELALWNPLDHRQGVIYLLGVISNFMYLHLFLACMYLLFLLSIPLASTYYHF